MARTKASTTVNHVEAAIYHLTALMEPTLAALKETPAKVGAGDTGQEPRRQASFRYFWQNVVNTAQHQLVGQMASGFDNATGLCTRSDMQFRELVRKHPEDDVALTLDPNYERIVSWMKVNEANKEFFEQIKLIGETLYEIVAGQPCVPQTFKPKESTVGAAISDAIKKKRLAELEELKAKVA